MKAKFVELESNEQLEALFEQSKIEPIVLFKHSNSCPISFGVYNLVSNVNAEINVVVVQKSRVISNEIALRTGIRHESPQAIILKNGVPIFNASHYEITARDLENFVNS